MIVIVQSTAIIAGSGTEANTVSLQGGSVSNENSIIQQGGVSVSNDLVQHGSLAGGNYINAFEGISQDTHIVAPSFIETTASGKVVVFPKDFSRGVYLAGVLGVTGTVQKFFDRSPFFFTPSEVDPNTLRDISEVQQFLVYSNASIASYDIFSNTVGTASLITDKGAEFSDQSLSPVNVITNGDFEQNFSNWTVVVSGSDQIEIVVEQPAGANTLSAGCCPPPQGDRMVWGDMNANNGSYMVNDSALGSRTHSSALESFSVKIASGFVDAFRVICFPVQFFDDNSEDPVFEIDFRITGLGCDSGDPAYANLNFYPDKIISLDSITSDTFYTLTSLIDLEQEEFSFTRVKLFVVFGSLGSINDFLLDDFQLTIDLVPEHLKKTNSQAHVNTRHPVASGYGLETIPFTISGTEDITQVDLSPPYFDETSPASGTSNVPEDSDLQFHVKDTSSALDQGTINVWADGLQIVSAGTTVTGTTWPIAFKTVLASNNIEYIFRRGSYFTPGSTVTVSGEFADFAAVSNYAEDVYQFHVVGSGGLSATISGAPDATSPTITATEPAPGATQVSPNTEIHWSLTDDSSGVDPSTVKLLLNGATILENDAVTEGSFSRAANSSRGYDYSYTPASPFEYGTTVTGTIIAADSAGNSDSLNYEFTITPTDTLEVQNFFLGLNESTLLSSGTLMSVEAIDYTYGVASGTTTLTVNGVVPSGLLTTYSGAGPDRIIFAASLEPLVDFREDLVILVHAENNFPGSFPVVKEEQYTLRPGYRVDWPNKTEDAAGGPETIFPYLTNIEVLTDVNNLALNCGTSSAYFKFLTEEQQKKDLGAVIVSNIKTKDLPANMVVLNPFFEYGKTMTLEIEAADLEGNLFTLTHTFVIESAPD